MVPLPSLARETVKSVAAGLFGATVPGLASLRAADAAVVHTMQDIGVGLAPMIFLNALMSALIPAVLMLRRQGPRRRTAGAGPVASMIGPALIVLGLATGGTLTVLGLIHLATSALSLSGLTAEGVLLVRAGQAAAVAAILTPLTLTLVAARSARG